MSRHCNNYKKLKEIWTFQNQIISTIEWYTGYNPGDIIEFLPPKKGSKKKKRSNRSTFLEIYFLGIYFQHLDIVVIHLP